MTSAASRLRAGLVLVVVLFAVLTPAGATELSSQTRVTDPCLGPVTEAEPGTVAWTARDTANQLCAEQRLLDAAARPPVVAPGTPSPAQDPHRHPALHDGSRFRMDEAVVVNRAGAELPTEIYRPCTVSTCAGTPPGVSVADGPYPAVVIVHGGASNRKLHWWAAQSLAEHGYLSVVFDVAENSGGDHGTDAQDVVDWLLSDAFPFAGEVDGRRVGIAGHSQGASTASLLGQLDPRLKAIVAWDNLTAVAPELWADDLGVDPPAGLAITTPALGIGADYSFTPRPYTAAPEPASTNGEGGRGRGVRPHPKDLGYQELRSAGVDAMLVVLRAANHLDFTPLHGQPSSRYGEAVATYYTLAWFDRHLRGADDLAVARQAHERLLADVFDGSADVHNISTGSWDPVDGNVPHRIAGLSACDRLSFYFQSRYALTEPGTADRVASETWREDCYAGGRPESAARP